MPFLEGNKKLGRTIYMGGAHLGKAHVPACAGSGRVKNVRAVEIIQPAQESERASLEGAFRAFISPRLASSSF